MSSFSLLRCTLRCVSLLAVLLSSQSLPDIARAEQTVISVSIVPGPLVLSPRSLTVEAVEPDGRVPFTAEVMVDDLTGTGRGWRVHVETKTMASIRTVEQVVLAGTAAEPSGAINYPVLLGSRSQAEVFDARAESGLGRILLVVRGEWPGGVPDPHGLTFLVTPGS